MILPRLRPDVEGCILQSVTGWLELPAPDSWADVAAEQGLLPAKPGQ